MEPEHHPESHDPGPHLPDPGSGPSRVAIAGLVLTLAVSLGVNLVVMQRLTTERSELETLRAQLRAQAAELETLRGRIRSPAGDDPLDKVASVVEELRHLRFKREVDVELLPASALRERIGTEYGENVKREELDATADVLRQFGVLPKDYDLYAELRALQEEQVAGFYDSETGEMVAAATDVRDPSPLSRVFLAHEYVHAVTDQHFDLQRLDALQDKSEDDEAGALQALIEGDATYVMSLYQAEALTADEQRQLTEELGSVSQSKLDTAPMFLQHSIRFPYAEGLQFVLALHRSSGFDAVDDAYRDPPTSSEQILHPAKYLSSNRDEPRAVELPDVAAALGSGWKRTQAGGMGEFDVREILDLAGDVGLSGSDAGAAAGGWDGGRYVAAADGDQVVVASILAWDSATEATEATRALERWLPLRFRNRGAAFDPSGSGSGWAGPDGAGMVVRAGDRVLWIMGTSQQAVQRARGAFIGF